MRLTFTAIAILFISTFASSATIYVPDNHPTIQDAINASANGDTIIVRPGTYMENIDFLGKKLTLQSEKGPNVTIINGNQSGSVVTFSNGEDLQSILLGFTVTNGRRPQGRGAGIYCDQSSPTISGNIISHNTAHLDGGGVCCIWNSSPSISNNYINGNVADAGGGIACVESSSPTIVNNIIVENATDTGSGGGGGIFSEWHSNPKIINNTIVKNSAPNGGGGGICCEYSTSADVVNTILWDNDAPEGPEICIRHITHPSKLIIKNSDVENGKNSVFIEPNCILDWGPGMIDADPIFAEPTHGDYHISRNSPCRDLGENSVVTEFYDFEGDPRIVLGTVDIGADELYYHLYHIGDIIPGSPIDIKVVGWPSAPVYAALNDWTLNPPLTTQHGILYITWPLLWSGNVGRIPANGILSLTANVPPGWTSGSEYYLQALVGPWGGPTTMLTNLMTLTVE